MRRGDNTVTLRQEEAQELAYRKGELHFEDEPATPYDAQDLEPGIITEFLEQYVQQKRFRDMPDSGQALRLARLTIQRDGQPWITKGGLLVFHKDPRRTIPGAYVRYFRYEGRDERSTLLRDEQFEGPIPTIIQKLREFLPTHLARFSYRREGVLTAEDEYPTAAWDEAMVNALEVGVHRIHARGKLDLAIYAQHVLSLTRLNWASTRAFCHAPITIKFAHDIAYLMNVFLATGADFRLHDRLWSTPWFL